MQIAQDCQTCRKNCKQLKREKIKSKGKLKADDGEIHCWGWEAQEAKENPKAEALLDELTRGIKRQNRMMVSMVSALYSFDFDKAYQDFAEFLGKPEAELTEGQRKGAIFRAILLSKEAKQSG